jgi:Tol biopolymer transport system component
MRVGHIRLGASARFRRTTGYPTLAVLLALIPAVAAPAPGDTELISVRYADGLANGGSYVGSKQGVSADGRYVVLRAHVEGLVPVAGLAAQQVYVRDRVTATTTRVSIGSDGTSANAHSDDAAISANGRYVAFASEAWNLVPGDTNNQSDVFVHDRETGVTELVSVGLGGAPANNWASGPSISADGRFVAFHSEATNLAPGDTNRWVDVYVRDRLLSTTEHVSVATNGAQANHSCWSPSISADGRYVAFGSWASSLAPDPSTVRGKNVYVRDRATGTTELIAVRSTKSFVFQPAPSLSADGRYVAFDSDAADLVPGDTNGVSDVFVYDRSTASTRRVSIAHSGAEALGPSIEPDISADGRYISFDSSASNLVVDDSNGETEVFVRDLVASTTQRVSITSSGAEASYGGSSWSSLSEDGSLVVFTSNGALSPADTNEANDVYAHERIDVAPAGSQFTLKPAAIDFGGVLVGSTGTKPLWLQNKGTRELRLKSISVRGIDRAMFRRWTTCRDVVAVGAGCRIVVSFTPTDIGQRTARVRVETAESEVRIRHVAGTGVL